MSNNNLAIHAIDHTLSSQALKIWSLFQSAYQIEADWLKIKHFPPLSRTIQAIQESTTEFWALSEQDAFQAVLEFQKHGNWIEIHSLAVSTRELRQGHGRAILACLIGHYPERIIELETALANQAAMALYKKAGFNIISQFETEHGLIKVRLRKTPS